MEQQIDPSAIASQITSQTSRHIITGGSNETTNPYNGRISRKLMEGICGISTNTLVKYETDGVIHPQKVKHGGREVVTYDISDIKAVLAKRGISYKKRDEAEVIAIFSQKGGVGKSAFCQHIAATLSLLGRVLVVDLDSQGDVSTLLDMRPKPTEVLTKDSDLDPTIAELMDWTLQDGQDAGYRRLSFEQVIKPVSPHLSIIPADLDLGEINFSLNRLPLSTRTFADGSEKSPPELYMVKDVIDQLKSKFDFILFDCPPNIETLNVGALLSANRILIPLEIEAKCILTIRRNEEFLRRLREMHDGFRWDKVLIVPNKYRAENIKTKALWALEEMYAGRTDIQLSQVVVPSSVIIDRCSESREPVYMAATKYGKEGKSWVSGAQEFTNYFWAVAHEILDIEIDHLVFPKNSSLEG